MKKVIITGASGMVGGIILQECLKSEQVEEVVSLVRRPTSIKHAKLKEVEVIDFGDLTQYESEFINVDAAYFCIGVYTGQVSNDLFKTITVDYTIAFADALKKNSPHARMCFLSGAGADRSEKSRVAFARYKGMAENYLLSSIENVHSFRPGYIYPVEKRVEPNFSYRISRRLYPLLKLFGKNMSVKSTELGIAMFEVGINGYKLQVLENKDIIESLT